MIYRRLVHVGHDQGCQMERFMYIYKILDTSQMPMLSFTTAHPPMGRLVRKLSMRPFFLATDLPQPNLSLFVADSQHR